MTMLFAAALLAAQVPTVRWEASLDAALVRCERENKAALVLFYADW